MNYYNEFDPAAAATLRELIVLGLIPDGVVDERSIQDVCPSDLAGFTQCHFFAGIGGWPLALKLAGIPSDTRLWTGSCPCQPFSAAGKGDGFADERHLWPDFHFLIEQCHPSVVLGEQVASADGLGWLDLVHADLEGSGYAFGAADLCAAGVGAPHIRQRLYWVAHSSSTRLEGRPRTGGTNQRTAWSDGVAHGLADSVHAGWTERGASAGQRQASGSGWIYCRDGKYRPTQPGLQPLAHGLPLGLAAGGARLAGLASVAGLDGASLKRAKRHRLAVLKGAGNAIVPEVAAAFIRAAIVTE